MSIYFVLGEILLRVITENKYRAVKEAAEFEVKGMVLTDKLDTNEWKDILRHGLREFL